MAEEVTAPTELTLDQELEALLNPVAPAAASDKGATPEAGTKPGEVASPPPAETPKEGEPAADPLLAALEAIPEDKPAEKPPEGQLSAEQSEVLKAVPNVQVAQQLYGIAENFTNFSKAFEGGEFEKVQGMFELWNKPAYEAFLEHIYSTKGIEFVDRWIAENDPSTKGQPHKELKAIRNEVTQLKNQLAAKATNSQQETERAEKTQKTQTAVTEYNKHVHSLFEQIKFSPADRPWIMDALNARIARDPKLLEDIRGGKPAAVNKAFKEICTAYVTRDKAITTGTAEKVALQAAKVPPIAGSGAAAEIPGALPDDIKQVPKGQEETWMDQQLSKLFGKKK